VSRIIDEHRLYLRDRNRVSAYRRALSEVVKPGDVVCDLASGTGILGLLACRAGASRVYAVEETAIAGLAREIAQANGFADSISSVRGHSRFVSLPERANVIVCDEIGGFGLETDIVALFDDARTRFLESGGTLIPHAIELMVAPVEYPPLHGRLRFWHRRPADFDFTPAAAMAVNTGYPARLKPAHLLGLPACAGRVDLTSHVMMPIEIAASLEASRDGVLHGIGGWFVARLSASVRLTNSPLSPDRIFRRPIVFPIEQATNVSAGTPIEVRMRILPSETLYTWEVTIGTTTFKHTTLRGMLIAREDLQRTSPAYRPALSASGEARLTVLQLADGQRTVAEIEREVYERHRQLFSSPAQAAVFVAEVVTRYG
jgi:Ribosomal protein L11 methyltransferase (PrmA)